MGQSDATAQILEAQADFALNLLREVSKQDNNGASSTVLSPISAATALAMVYAGAKGRTAQEMGQVLAKGAPESEVHEFFGQLLRTMNADGLKKSYTLEVANRVYVGSGFQLLDTFKRTIDGHYGGQFESVDFAQNVDTAKKINKFVEQATQDKIRDLVEPEMLNASTRLALVNAIYFKGNWADKFDAHETRKEPFYMSEGNSKQLDMMHKRASFIYHENDQLQLLGMPYAGQQMFMFLVLPKKRFGAGQLLANMTGACLLELVQQRDKKQVDVVLPKFKLESSHPLESHLASLGMPDAFEDSANFSGIAGAQLQISTVLQKAFIETNEEGSEATAATIVLMKTRCAVMCTGPVPNFHADHPFHFLITQNDGGTVLFAGTMAG